jgi:membrane protein YqaA with SNARE-associated domain
MQPAATHLPWYRQPILWIRALYDWTLGWAESRYATPALFVLAFVESSFFPIPPDVLLIALAVAKPARSFFYAGVATIGSVMGGAFGWWLGTTFWQSLGVHDQCMEFGGGHLLFAHVPGFTCEVFGKVRDLYAEDAMLYLFVAAFTPIPYKVFTIAAGVFSIDLPLLIVASFVGRGARFFLVAALIRRFGAPIRRFLESRFELMTIVFAILLAGGVAAIKCL